MNYYEFRIQYQDSEQAARDAFKMAAEMSNKLIEQDKEIEILRKKIAEGNNYPLYRMHY